MVMALLEPPGSRLRGSGTSEPALADRWGGCVRGGRTARLGVTEAPGKAVVSATMASLDSEILFGSELLSILDAVFICAAGRATTNG